jgi:hypothetical protein
MSADAHVRTHVVIARGLLCEEATWRFCSTWPASINPDQLQPRDDQHAAKGLEDDRRPPPDS